MFLSLSGGWRDQVLRVPGSRISRNAQRPKPPWLFTAGTQSVRAVATLAILSFFFSPVTSTIRFNRTSPLPKARGDDAGDVVGNVVVSFAVQGIGDREAQVVVLDVADYLVHVFKGLGELLLPGTGIGHDVGNMALVRARGIDRPGRVEIDVARRAERVIRAEDRLQRPAVPAAEATMAL